MLWFIAVVVFFVWLFIQLSQFAASHFHLLLLVVGAIVVYKAFSESKNG